MNAAALTASRPLIPSAPSARAKDSRQLWRAAEKLVWSALCFFGLVLLLIAGGALAFGTLAMIATVLGGREDAWWPAITSGVLLYLFAKGSILCWDEARKAFDSSSRLRRG